METPPFTFSVLRQAGELLQQKPPLTRDRLARQKATNPRGDPLPAPAPSCELFESLRFFVGVEIPAPPLAASALPFTEKNFVIGLLDSPLCLPDELDCAKRRGIRHTGCHTVVEWAWDDKNTKSLGKRYPIDRTFLASRLSAMS